MKKAFFLVVLTALALAAYFFSRQRSEMDLGLGQAAVLAPADALVYMEFPDMARTAVRWEKTSLAAIGREPEWQAFAGKWREFVASLGEVNAVFGVLGEIQKADPVGLFWAVGNFDMSKMQGVPPMVGGFPYRGKKQDVKRVIDRLRGMLIEANPGAKSELSQFEGTDIETLSGASFQAVLAYRENWFFFGTDLGLVQNAILRQVAPERAKPGLASDALFQNTVAQGMGDGDFRAFVRWNALMQQVQAASALSLMSVGIGASSHQMDPTGTEAMLYEAKLDGLLMRDRLYYRMAKPPKVEPMSEKALGFTSGETYGYLAWNIDILQQYASTYLDMLKQLGMMDELEKQLATKGLKVADIFTTFGGEIALHSDWEVGALALPTLFASVEVRDAEKARLFADWIAGEMKSESEPLMEKKEGTTQLWSQKGPILYLQPTLGVNEKHLLFALNMDTASRGLRAMESGKRALGEKPAYQTALGTVTKPTMSLLYLDTATLFERLYERGKPMAAYALLGNEVAAKYFDSDKLPAAQTISRHLLPTVISYGDAPQGSVMESTGSVSLFQAYVPLIGVGIFGMQRMQMTAPPVPVAPAQAPTVTPASGQ